MQHYEACGWDGKLPWKRAPSPPGATASHLSQQSSQCPQRCGAGSGFSECKMASCFARKLPRVGSLPPPGGQRRAWSWAPRLAAAGTHANCASSGYATVWDATGAQPCIQADSTRRQGFYPANRLEESNQVLRIEYFSSSLRGAQRARKRFRDNPPPPGGFWKGRKSTKETRKTAGRDMESYGKETQCSQGTDI